MIQPFRWHCQKVLPTVFDESLSYYELLNKVVEHLNLMINDVNTNSDRIETLRLKHEALVKYTLTYFDSLDVQKEIDNKLDRMAERGELESIFAGFTNTPENQSVAYPRLWKMCADTSTYEMIDGVETKTEWAAQSFAYIDVPRSSNIAVENNTAGHKYLFIGYSSDIHGEGLNKITAYRVDNGNMIELSSLYGIPVKPAYVALKYNTETNHIIVFTGCASADAQHPQKIYYSIWSNEIFAYGIQMDINPANDIIQSYDITLSQYLGVSGESYNNVVWYAVFSNKNNLYGYCRIGNTLHMVNIDAQETADGVILSYSYNTTLQGLKNVSRTFQEMSTDGKRIYYCMSNPNVIAVYTLDGIWERYINIGEYAGDVFIGELEQVEEIDGKLYILGQFYFDRTQKGRMGAIFEVDFKHSMPESYPHTCYEVTQRNIYIDTSIPVNSWVYQDGSEKAPFAALHVAYFSACNHSNNAVNIVYKNPAENKTVTVERWEYQTDKDINVNCNQPRLTVIFNNIRVGSGSLQINGGIITKFDTFGRSNFSARNVIFKPNAENETHYNIDGHIALYGVYTCATDIQNVFNFSTGSVGVIHITQNTNKIAQTNATTAANVQTINCFNLGDRFKPYVAYEGSGIRVDKDIFTLYPHRMVNFTIKISNTSYHTFWAIVPTLTENSDFWCVSTTFTSNDNKNVITVSYKFRALPNNHFSVGRIDITKISDEGNVTKLEYTHNDITDENPDVFDNETPLVKIEYDLK